MIFIFNILVIGLVALIAYWWSNEGAFSSLMHLVCVIVAGAVAIAVWEPFFFNLMFVEGSFGGLMPGLTLLLTFIITLLITRAALDKIAPEGAFLQEGLDAVVGGVFGACSGVITIGMLVVGVGFIHQPWDAFGYTGWGRASTGPVATGMVAKPASGLWFPVDTLTMDFYEMASMSTLRPGGGDTPLALANPDLDRLASLVRDTVREENGRMGATVINPEHVTVGSSQRVEAQDRGDFLLVTLKVGKKSFDFKGPLMLSSSQVRLIGRNGNAVQTFHPTAWGQPEGKPPAPIVFRVFDADDRFATSPTGHNEADLRLVFAVPSNFNPEFIQIRSTRFPLGGVTVASDIDALLASAGGVQGAAEDIQFGGDISAHVSSGAQAARFDRKIKPSTEKVDQHGGIFDEESRRLVQIDADFKPNKPGENPRGKLAIKGYHVDEGAAIVRVACHPGTVTDIFTAARKLRVPMQSPIQLLDVNNNHWNPIGYELVQPNRLLMMVRDGDLTTLQDLPHRPRSGSDDRFYLIFEVPVGTQVAEVRLGEDLLGTISGVAGERYLR